MIDTDITAPADTQDVAENLMPPEKPKVPRKPRRVVLTHRKMKGEASPMSDALEPWLAAGWVRK